MNSPASFQLFFYLLNREEVRVGSSELPPIRMRKARALLFFLVAEYSYYGRHLHRREYLASLFWPDHDREAGLENLRQIWYQVRKHLKKAGVDGVFRSDRRQIGLAADLRWGTDLSFLAEGRSDQLLQLPMERIEPLPGIVFYEEEVLAEWLERFRANVQHDAVRAFSQAIDREKEKQNWESIEQLGVRYLAQSEEPERGAYETMAQACFFREKTREAKAWLLRAGLTPEEIEQWLREKRKSVSSAGGRPKAIRLAVLPLQVVGPSPDQDLSMGLLEDLIAELSVFEELDVVPSLSTLPFYRGEVTAEELASRLAVAYFLYGTIRTSKKGLSIAMQLVQAPVNRVTWSQTFDGKVSDLFTIQQQVVRNTLAGLQKKLPILPEPTPGGIPDPKAYQLYLQGWSIYFRGNPDSTREAARYFQEATELAPDFHRAHLGFAVMLSSLASWWGDQLVGDVKKDFYQALRRASEDRQLRFEVSGISGWFNMWQWKLEAAERDFQHAMLQPSDTSFCFPGYTHLLMVQERYEEAFAIASEGMNKNPNHVLHRSMLSNILLLTQRYEECERICRAILLQMPEKHSTLTDLIWCLILDGRPEEAIEVGETFLRRSDQRLYFVIGRLALAYLAANEQQKATRLYREMKTAWQAGRKGYPYFMALYQQAAGQSERALDLLERHLPDQLTDYLWLRVQPEFKPLHHHPRFRALLQAVFGEK